MDYSWDVRRQDVKYVIAPDSCKTPNIRTPARCKVIKRVNCRSNVAKKSILAGTSDVKYVIAPDVCNIQKEMDNLGFTFKRKKMMQRV